MKIPQSIIDTGIGYLEVSSIAETEVSEPCDQFENNAECIFYIRDYETAQLFAEEAKESFSISIPPLNSFPLFESDSELGLIFYIDLSDHCFSFNTVPEFIREVNGGGYNFTTLYEYAPMSNCNEDEVFELEGFLW